MPASEITLNGDPFSLPEGCDVRRLVELATGSAEGRGVAVAVNGEVVPRGEWTTTTIERGQRVELLVATQGG
ncbi:MAG: sulfur carrier protein ThiS [Actinobacteria bacterium]|nr:sulfur carrier protein ThiS [Actinomycetota bacterium]